MIIVFVIALLSSRNIAIMIQSITTTHMTHIARVFFRLLQFLYRHYIIIFVNPLPTRVARAVRRERLKDIISSDSSPSKCLKIKYVVIIIAKSKSVEQQSDGLRVDNNDNVS